MKNVQERVNLMKKCSAESKGEKCSGEGKFNQKCSGEGDFSLKCSVKGEFNQKKFRGGRGGKLGRGEQGRSDPRTGVDP